jgi:hypothetical protein
VTQEEPARTKSLATVVAWARRLASLIPMPKARKRAEGEATAFYVKVLYEKQNGRVKLVYKFPPVGKCGNVSMRVEDDNLIVEASCDENVVAEIERKMREFGERCS